MSFRENLWKVGVLYPNLFRDVPKYHHNWKFNENNFSNISNSSFTWFENLIISIVLFEWKLKW